MRTHPGLDDLHSKLVAVREALDEITEAIDEGLRLLELQDGDDDDGHS